MRPIFIIILGLTISLPALAQKKPSKYSVPKCSLEIGGAYFKLGESKAEIQMKCESVPLLKYIGLWDGKGFIFTQQHFPDTSASYVIAEGKLNTKGKSTFIQKYWGRHEETSQAKNLIGLVKNILEGQSKKATVSVKEVHGPGKDIYTLIIDCNGKQAVCNLVYDNGSNCVEILEVIQ